MGRFGASVIGAPTRRARPRVDAHAVVDDHAVLNCYLHRFRQFAVPLAGTVVHVRVLNAIRVARCDLLASGLTADDMPESDPAAAKRSPERDGSTRCAITSGGVTSSTRRGRAFGVTKARRAEPTVRGGKRVAHRRP